MYLENFYLLQGGGGGLLEGSGEDKGSLVSSG